MQRRTNETITINKKIGGKLREYRTIAGLSGAQLGEKLNISYQQIQKYECGQDGLSAAKLLAISAVLDVPAAEFISDGKVVKTSRPAQRNAIKVMRNFLKIKDKKSQKVIAGLIEVLVARDEK